jgi:hypothetical protein
MTLLVLLRPWKFGGGSTSTHAFGGYFARGEHKPKRKKKKAYQVSGRYTESAVARAINSAPLIGFVTEIAKRSHELEAQDADDLETLLNLIDLL